MRWRFRQWCGAGRLIGGPAALLWTHVGISGPVVMDASRFWCLARERGEAAALYGNFLPGLTLEAAREWFLAQSAEHPRRSLLKILATLVPEPFG